VIVSGDHLVVLSIGRERSRVLDWRAVLFYREADEVVQVILKTVKLLILL
jgi:hypothetical protein